MNLGDEDESVENGNINNAKTSQGEWIGFRSLCHVGCY